jgi:hypothetical protein
LLIDRENLRSGEMEDNEIKNNKDDIEITNYEKNFFNYINRCAVSLHSANLIIDRATAEIASTY